MSTDADAVDNNSSTNNATNNNLINNLVWNGDIVNDGNDFRSDRRYPETIVIRDNTALIGGIVGGVVALLIVVGVIMHSLFCAIEKRKTINCARTMVML
jgi:hypothetical protein